MFLECSSLRVIKAVVFDREPSDNFYEVKRLFERGRRVSGVNVVLLNVDAFSEARKTKFCSPICEFPWLVHV